MRIIIGLLAVCIAGCIIYLMVTAVGVSHQSPATITQIQK